MKVLAIARGVIAAESVLDSRPISVIGSIPNDVNCSLYLLATAVAQQHPVLIN